MNADDFIKNYGIERYNTGATKWDSLKERFGEDGLLPLWIADMEFKTVPQVTEVIKSRAEQGTFGYEKVPDSFFTALFKWQARHGMEIKRDDLRFSSGIIGSLFSLVYTYTQPGESVIVTTPVYYPFFDAIINSGRKMAECELKNTGGVYTLDLERFEKVIIESKAKLFILCSPHNPVARVWTEEELRGMLEICHRHGLVVVSDEVHQDYISPGHSFVSVSTIDGGKYKDSLIIVNSGSKTFNLAGLSHSFLIIYNEKLKTLYDNFMKTLGMGPVNILGFAGTEAAYRHGEQWLTGANALVKKNYDFWKAEFASKAPKVIISPLEGTYLLWMDLRGYIGTGPTADFTQKKCRLAVNVGEKFIARGGEGFIRVNLATLPKYVEEAAGRIIGNLG
ncbi:MAG: PatB family C-S lyase [Treponema sp.]|nr:PatB family C-S lyase [Treponema sp.]